MANKLRYGSDILGTKLSELEDGSTLSLRLMANEQKLQLNAILKSHIRNDVILITLLCDTSKKISFENVRTDLEFCPDGNIPIIWYTVKVVHYKDDIYAVQVFSDGTRHNRRSTFRVGISSPARIRNPRPGIPREVMIKDISLTGFSVSDRKKELSLSIGDSLSVFWEDFGYELDLAGQVVRIEEHDDIIIYGFELHNVCKDLAPYINKKQRQKR